MQLGIEQVDRFYDLLNALYRYTNDRFHVVDIPDDPSIDPLLDLKLELVAQELWENVDIIDAFIEDNPENFDGSELADVIRFKYALHATYDLVEYANGYAMLVGDAGVFAVSGVDVDIVKDFGPAPGKVECTLLPFAGTIVQDGFSKCYDIDPRGGERQRMMERYRTMSEQGIVGTSDEFVERAKSYLDSKRESEMEQLLDSLGGASKPAGTLPPGFHRGALAYVADRHAKGAGPAPLEVALNRMCEHQMEPDVIVGPPRATLRECLQALPADDLESLADLYRIEGAERISAESLVERIAQVIFDDGDATQLLMMPGEMSLSDLNVLEALVKRRDLSFSEDELWVHRDYTPMIPYTYLFKDQGRYVYVLPEDVRFAVENLDFDLMRGRLTDYREATCVADACVAFYGAVTMSDAYRTYQHLTDGHLGYDDFARVCADASEACIGDFVNWRSDNKAYLLHTTLSDFGAMNNAAYNMTDEDFDTLMDAMADGALHDAGAQAILMKLQQDAEGEVRYLDDIRAAIISEHQRIALKPLDRELAHTSPTEYLMGNPTAVALIRYFGECVPDGYDDYLFPLLMVESLIDYCVTTGSMPDLVAHAQANGYRDAGDEDSQLHRLLSNLYDAMPSWDYNGWSRTEVREVLTGRRVFYNDDGTPIKVGPNEPCPCGSGKRYRDCHGR